MHILKRAHCGSFFEGKNQFTLELESFENTLSLNLKELNEYNSKQNG